MREGLLPATVATVLELSTSGDKARALTELLGEVIDPTIHEALMAMPMEGDHTEQVISAVVQKGIRLGDRVVRPARGGVAEKAKA